VRIAAKKKSQKEEDKKKRGQGLARLALFPSFLSLLAARFFSSAKRLYFAQHPREISHLFKAVNANPVLRSIPSPPPPPPRKKREKRVEEGGASRASERDIFFPPHVCPTLPPFPYSPLFLSLPLAFRWCVDVFCFFREKEKSHLLVSSSRCVKSFAAKRGKMTSREKNQKDRRRMLEVHFFLRFFSFSLPTKSSSAL